jgi:putative transposase
MTRYNPNIHHRRSIRLKGYDYRQAGLYFITICCEDRVSRFGHIENGIMLLNECGQIACDEWYKLPERYPVIELDIFQLMPNHIHGIIAITVGATLAVAPPTAVAPLNNNVDKTRARVNRAPTIGDIVGAYKSLVTNGCLKIYKSKNELMGKLWQRNFWEHIIRDEVAYLRISDYIINNPAKWIDDKLNPDQNNQE